MVRNNEKYQVVDAMTANEPSQSTQSLLDGSAWHAFCDALKVAGDTVAREGVPGDPLTRAEGYRYLTRLLRAGLEKNIEFGDPCYPHFFSLSHETIKIGNDNPDNFYQNCTIDGRYDYRITGQRGSVDYLSLETKAGGYDSTGSMEMTGHIEASELTIDADGGFEIIVSQQQPGAGSDNWLPADERSTSIIVRQTFLDRAAEVPASLRIECLNPDTENRLDPASFAQQLQSATRFVSGTANLFVDWMQLFTAHSNALPSNDQSMCIRAGGDSAIHYMNSQWQLADDEALIVEAAVIPGCKTWNFQLSNYWMESLDYRHHRIHTNKHLAHYEPDGSLRIVVAHSDPGPQFANWLTTDGHNHGAMLFRWVEADEHPPVSARVVKFDALAST